MNPTGTGLNPKSFYARRRYRPHEGDGCILCGSENCAPYQFYCAQQVNKTVERIAGSRDTRVTRTYQIRQTVTGKLCADCIRYNGVSNILIGLAAAAVIVGLWVLLWRLGIGLVILPILFLLGALGMIATGIVRFFRKTPTQQDGDDALRDLLRENYPGYAKYMTRSEWGKQPKA